MENVSSNKYFVRDVQSYKKSLALGMEFLKGAVIDDCDDPDDHSIMHMYHTGLNGWNRPYMELAGQVVREAFLPYADFTKNRKWVNLAERVIVDGVLAHALCKEPDSPAFGLLANCADPLCTYGSPITDDDQLVQYRLDRQGFLADNPDYRPNKQIWYTFDSAEILIAAILLKSSLKNSYRQTILDEFIEISWKCFLKLIDGHGNLSQAYDENEGKWLKHEIITSSRLLWACGLMKQSQIPQPDDTLTERLAGALLTCQRSNGIIVNADDEIIVSEFVIYCIEGLYWGGALLNKPACIKAALSSFNALMQAPHVMTSSPCMTYDRNWVPNSPQTLNGSDGIIQEIHHASVIGQVARLAFLFWKYT